MVNTIRTATSGISPLKRWLSEAFYRALNRLSDVHITPNAADFRLLDRAAADALRSLPERTAFLRGLTAWIGFSQTWVQFEAAERYAGETKYSLGRMVKFALSGVLSLSTRPLRVAVWSGLLLFALSWLYGLWAVWAKFVAQQAVPGWASIIWLILLAGSIQLIVLGIIAEYIGNIYEEVKARPAYLIRDTTGPLEPPSQIEEDAG